MENTYKMLLSEGKIGNLTIKNRIFQSPMGTGFTNPDGSASKTEINYYIARARGGIGMIISEVQWITTKTDPMFEFMSAHDTDVQRDAWKAFADAVHPYGTKFCVQVSPGLGRLAFLWGTRQPVSASEMPSYYNPEIMCRALTTQEVDELVECYRRAGRRAKEAGVDAFEIHAHSGYLLDQFMTEAWNHRTDKYGGRKEEIAREAGATDVIISNDHDEIQNQLGRIAPAGAECIVEASGYNSMCKLAVKNLGKKGILYFAALYKEPIPFSPNMMMNGTYKHGGMGEWDAVPNIEKLMGLAAEGKLPVDKLVRFYRFDEMDKAMDDFANQRVIKAVLKTD